MNIPAALAILGNIFEVFAGLLAVTYALILIRDRRRRQRARRRPRTIYEYPGVLPELRPRTNWREQPPGQA